jgi:hypothetical protein
LASIQIKLRQRAAIMLMVCELVESFLPEDDKAISLVSRAMDLPLGTSWLDD